VEKPALSLSHGAKNKEEQKRTKHEVNNQSPIRQSIR